jgi:hypothetical protein
MDEVRRECTERERVAAILTEKRAQGESEFLVSEARHKRIQWRKCAEKNRKKKKSDRLR